jgi:hypothetical protein
VPTQNSLINDPPTSYYTLMSLAKHDPAAFHWNPFIAGGIPGWGSTAAAVLSPFILIPTLSVPLPWVYTAIIFLKLNAAFWFAYFWLREERLGKRGAAIGALIVAAAGVITVRWLWQSTNASALYPALLWLGARGFNGKKNSIAGMVVIALAYALAGFPAAMAYGAYVSLAYVIFLTIRERRAATQLITRGAIAVVIALMIASPSLVPYIQLLRRTGYLPTRERVSIDFHYPLKHARLFLFPDALGNNALKNWLGDPQLRAFNNYYEATLYLGVVTIALLLIGLLARRARSRWFWLATMLVLLAAMFGLAPFVGYLPGIKYSWLTRLTIVLPLPAGYLAAAGASLLSRRRVIAFLIAAAVAWDLGLFAARFYPYLDPSEADVPVTPTIAFLQCAAAAVPHRADDELHVPELDGALPPRGHAQSFQLGGEVPQDPAADRSERVGRLPDRAAVRQPHVQFLRSAGEHARRALRDRAQGDRHHQVVDLRRDEAGVVEKASSRSRRA